MNAVKRDNFPEIKRTYTMVISETGKIAYTGAIDTYRKHFNITREDLFQDEESLLRRHHEALTEAIKYYKKEIIEDDNGTVLDSLLVGSPDLFF